MTALDATYAGVLSAGIAAAWLVNFGIKVFRLKRSTIFEEHASYTLLRTRAMMAPLIAAFVCVAISGLLVLSHAFPSGLVFAAAGVLLSRYLFFVSVVPLNMALTYVRRQAA
jgi:hypothetical protein